MKWLNKVFRIRRPTKSKSQILLDEIHDMYEDNQALWKKFRETPGPERWDIYFQIGDNIVARYEKIKEADDCINPQ